MNKNDSESVAYSPYSQKDGKYLPELFTKKELSDIKQLAAKILNKGECVIPMVPENIIHSSIEWYAQKFIDQLLLEVKSTEKEASLENFKKIAGEYLITYNLEGAKWFKKIFERYCLEKLRKHFENIDSLKDVNLEIIPIHVTSSTGKKSFGETRVKSWDAKKAKRRHVFSLEDIGDRGNTQEAIQQLALDANALSFTSVNMLEKTVLDDVEEKKQKKSHPNIALLQIFYAYVLGVGLDDGERELTRTFGSIVILCEEIPQTSQLFFKGKL